MFPKNAVRGELGRNPILIDVILNILQCYRHLISNPTHNDILDAALSESISIHNSKIFSWYSIIDKLKTSLGIDINNNSISKTSIRNKLMNIFEETWKVNFIDKYHNSHQGKFDNLVKFKNKFQFENYLNDIRNRKARVMLTRFRLSSHKLKIETGRYSNPPVPREDRLCHYCQSVLNIREVEDEVHFMMICPQHNVARNELLDKVFSLSPAARCLDIGNLFYFMMTAEKDHTSIIAHFLETCLPK